MAYDSIKKKVNDYTQKKTDMEEEDFILSQDELQLDTIFSGGLNLDSDLQEKLGQIRREFASERSRIDGIKDELDAEKENISSDISRQMRLVYEAKYKLSEAESMRYGKGAEEARRKSEEHIRQLEATLDEMGEDSFGAGLGDSLGGNSLGDVTYMEGAGDVGDALPAGNMTNNTGTVFAANPVNTPNASNSSNASNTPNPVYGNGNFVPLLTTAQTIQTIWDDKKEVDIFDHPFAPNNYRICNQGSAYGYCGGPTQTCGCCSCGTIINKAGGNINEHDMVNYAYNHGLCAGNGSTTPQCWVGMLKAAGIDSQDVSGTSLENLADYIEKGHGVVIGVSARTYCRKMYGRYFPGRADGHAIVLESVIRDHKTGKILEYVVSDSNGDSRDNACHRVTAKVLERAFKRKHNAAVVTNEVIW